MRSSFVFKELSVNDNTALAQCLALHDRSNYTHVLSMNDLLIFSMSLTSCVQERSCDIKSLPLSSRFVFRKYISDIRTRLRILL